MISKRFFGSFMLLACGPADSGTLEGKDTSVQRSTTGGPTTTCTVVGQQRSIVRRGRTRRVEQLATGL
jgi:hypothetical protein